MKRILMISLGIGCLVLLTAVIGLRSIMRSHQVAKHVTTRLEALYGGPVQVEEVDIGLGSSSLSGIALYEEGSDVKKDTPWLKVASLTTDVSLWDILSGDAMPKRITLTGATLVLRFDRAGDLLTRLPAQLIAADGPGAEALEKPDSFPAAEIKKGEIIFRKEGQTDLAVKNVNVKLTPEEGRLILHGTGDSAELGKLSLDGALTTESSLATVSLKTDARVPVSQSILERIPFVPACVWEEIQIQTGETTAELILSYDLNKKTLHYRVGLAPEQTQLSIPSIDLRARAVSGKVIIDDNVVQLRDVKGQAFGGQLATEADLDFRGVISKLRFAKIKVEELNVNELPEAWDIPAFVRAATAKGKLSGNASLLVTIVPGKLGPGAVGSLAALAGGPPGVGSGAWLPAMTFFALLDSHEVHVQGQGKGLVRDAEGKGPPIEFDWRLAPRRLPAANQSSLFLNHE